MMSNLFSIFEPSNWMEIPMGWTVLLLMTMVSPMNKFSSMSKIALVHTIMNNELLKEMESILGKKNKKMILSLLTLFTMIFYMNFISLMPYVFSPTSHMNFSMTLSLPIFLGVILYGFKNKTKYMMAHLLPSSTPGLLMPFMVVIESISMLIRPFTLAIRLTANMIAGHLLLTLIGENLSESTMKLVLPLMMGELALSILELAVSAIQAYVFSTLMTLYINDIEEM